MILDWLFGKKSKDPNIQAVWVLVNAKRVFIDVEKILADAVVNCVRKAELLVNAPNLNDTKLNRELRNVYDAEKHAFDKEVFERKNLDKALHLLESALSSWHSRLEGYPDASAQEIKDINELKEKLDEWHKNLQAQMGWLALHPTIPDIRAHIDDLKTLINAEGKILFNLRAVNLHELVKRANELIAKSEYAAQGKFQYAKYKEELSKKAWSYKVFYHGYIDKGGARRLLTAGVLDPAEYPNGFFVAQTKHDVVEFFRQEAFQGKLKLLLVRVSKHLLKKRVSQVPVFGPYNLVGPDSDTEMRCYIVKVKFYDIFNAGLRRKYIQIETI